MDAHTDRRLQWSMPAPEQTMESLRPRTPISDLLRALEARRRVIVHHRDDYLDVRTGEAGGAALFAHVDRVAIAVTPARGFELEGRAPFSLLIPRTPVVAYIVISADDVAAYFDEVRDLALEALDWRACGRTPQLCARCGVGCPSWRETCPNCWFEVDAAGHCGCAAHRPEAERPAAV